MSRESSRRDAIIQQGDPVTNEKDEDMGMRLSQLVTSRYAETELSKAAFLVLHGRNALIYEYQQQNTSGTLKEGTYLLLKMLSVPV